MDAQCHLPAPLPMVKSPDTHCRGGWVGPMGHMYRFREEKITCPQRGLNLGRPTHSESLYINYIKKDNKLFEGKMVEEPNCLCE